MSSKTRISETIRKKVFKRAHGYCEYCRCPDSHSTSPFAVEHIIPLIKGGVNFLINLALACQGCNNHKFTKTTALDPLTNTIVPLFHPRLDKWNEHFCWSEDLLLMVGLTPVGRATILALKLNRKNVVNLRKLLLLGGLHPPKHF